MAKPENFAYSVTRMNLNRIFTRQTFPLLGVLFLIGGSSCTTSPPSAAHPVIAVAQVRNMTGDSRFTALTERLHSGLVNDLYNETPFQVLETARLDEVIQESQQNFKPLKLQGAQALLFVSLTSLTNQGLSTGDWGGVSASNDLWTAVFDARLVSVDSGVILATAQASGQSSRMVAKIAGTSLGSTDTTSDLQRQAAEKALQQLCQKLGQNWENR